MDRVGIIASLTLAATLLCSPSITSAQDDLGLDAPLRDFMPDPTLDTPLDEAELLAAFTDKTHRGSYNFKRENIETFAFEETTTSDGRTHHQHGQKLDTGTWRVKANVICFLYDDTTRHACFNIYKRGNCFYHYNIRTGVRGTRGEFTARSVHAGETPDCEPAMS